MIKETDKIILLNENYADMGLHTGYIGLVVENFIRKNGYVLADFPNPYELVDLCTLVKIKSEDFRLVTNSEEDKRALKKYREIFKK